jgi:D-alanyl-D-alanine endopeptidase (penicillin-binding protein 7)
MLRLLLSLSLVLSVLCNTLPVSAKEITAESWLISNNGNITSSKNSKEVRSIASITKLVTVMVFLDMNPYPSEKHKELIRRSLISSDNKASKTLCDDFIGGHSDCIFMMNLKASQLGLKNTRFIEPTGLSIFNVSTAEELVKIVEEASKYPLIVESSNTKSLKIKKRVYTNTNPHVNMYNVMVSKTGYIRMSGGCIVVMIKTHDGLKTAILLGSKNTHTRIREMDRLLKS